MWGKKERVTFIHSSIHSKTVKRQSGPIISRSRINVSIYISPFHPSIQSHPLTHSPTNSITPPIDRDAPLSQTPRIDALKNPRADINVLEAAALAGIDDGGLGQDAAGGGVVDVDFGAAEGVGVWVCGVVHHLDGEGDDGVGVFGGVAAGAEACGFYE